MNLLDSDCFLLLRDGQAPIPETSLSCRTQQARIKLHAVSQQHCLEPTASQKRVTSLHRCLTISLAESTKPNMRTTEQESTQFFITMHTAVKCGLFFRFISYFLEDLFKKKENKQP